MNIILGATGQVGSAIVDNLIKKDCQRAMEALLSASRIAVGEANVVNICSGWNDDEKWVEWVE